VTKKFSSRQLQAQDILTNQFLEGRLTDGYWHLQPTEGHAKEKYYALPGGLVDAHAHLTLDLAKTGLATGSRALIKANLDKQLQSGVLALRDAGQVPNGIIRDSSLQVVRAGAMLAPEGRYHPGLYPPTPAENLISQALEEVEGGAQWVKIIADFPGPDDNWFQPIVNYPIELIAQLVSEVHAVGARVMTHVSGPLVADLIRVGVDSIEHGPEVTEALVKEMAERGTAWIPTLWTVHRSIAPLAQLDNPIGNKVREVMGRWRETLPLAVQLGVPVLAGSDEAPHGSLHLEIEALVQFGLSPIEAIKAASSVARNYFNLPARANDVVLYARDPREEVAALAHPALVIHRGRVISESVLS
jgi:imidazolonepropionase-like amidohydrolase